MQFTNMQEMLTSIREFIKTNPDAYFATNDIPKQLSFGFKAIVADTVYEWTISLVKAKEGFTEDERKIVASYLDAKSNLNKAEANYLNMVTGTTVR